MRPTATAISAAALDAALHSYPTRGDLAREIMLRLHWLHDRRGLDAMQAMGGGQVFGEDHLARLRSEWNHKQEVTA
jgi:hypothetical protein